MDLITAVDFPPSIEQQRIYAWAARQPNPMLASVISDAAWSYTAEIRKVASLVVVARAGTGKTTTILQAGRYAPEAKILYTAFNRDIADELNRRLKLDGLGPHKHWRLAHRAKAMTMHGLGFSYIRTQWPSVSVSEVQRARVQAIVNAVVDDSVPMKVRTLIGKLNSAIRELAPHVADERNPVDYMKARDIALDFEHEPDEEMEDAGFDLEFIVRRAIAGTVFAADDVPPPTGIDFADMIFLPLRKGWLIPRYDLLFIDEAQDMTQTQLELALGAKTPGGRVALVGDDRQAIYAFRGADSHSLSRLKTELHAAELGLKTTYRCPALVVRDAKLLVPDFEAAPHAPQGTIRSLASLDVMVTDLAPYDYVVSRTNAPLAKVATALLRKQKRVKIRGKAFGEGLAALVTRLLTGRAQSSIPAFLERLDHWKEKEIERATAADRDDLIPAITDKAETIRIITEGALGPRELVARIEGLFGDKVDDDAIICSSVHKVKGLQAKRVYVLVDTLYPAPPPGAEDAEPDPDRLQEERNIHYVAVTRSMDTLVYVNGK